MPRAVPIQVTNSLNSSEVKIIAVVLRTCCTTETNTVPDTLSSISHSSAKLLISTIVAPTKTCMPIVSKTNSRFANAVAFRTCAKHSSQVIVGSVSFPPSTITMLSLSLIKHRLTIVLFKLSPSKVPFNA